MGLLMVISRHQACLAFTKRASSVKKDSSTSTNRTRRTSCWPNFHLRVPKIMKRTSSIKKLKSRRKHPLTKWALKNWVTRHWMTEAFLGWTWTTLWWLLAGARRRRQVLATGSSEIHMVPIGEWMAISLWSEATTTSAWRLNRSHSNPSYAQNRVVIHAYRSKCEI